MSTASHKLDSVYSWMLCAGATISNGLCNSMVFSFGVMLPVFMKEFNQSREKTALIGSLTYAVGSFLAIVAAKLCVKLGCQRTHVIGTLSCAVSLFVSSWATGILFIYSSLCLVYGMGLIFSSMACFLIVSTYFKKRSSLALGIVSAGSSAGFFIMGPSLQALVDAVGWRNSFRIISSLFLGTCLISCLFSSNVEREPTGHEEHDLEEITDNYVKEKVVDFSVWKKAGYTIPVVSLMVITFSHFSSPIHLVRHCQEMGISSKRSSYLFIGIGLGSLVSRICTGKLCEYVNPVRVNQLVSLCSGVSTLLLSMNSSYIILVLLTVMYGLADGGFVATFNIIPLTCVPPDKRAFALGFTNVVCTATIATGPMLTGLVADRYSYREAFLMSGTVTIAGALVPLVLFCFKSDKQASRPKEKLVVYERVTVL